MSYSPPEFEPPKKLLQMELPVSFWEECSFLDTVVSMTEFEMSDLFVETTLLLSSSLLAFLIIDCNLFCSTLKSKAIEGEVKFFGNFIDPVS